MTNHVDMERVERALEYLIRGLDNDLLFPSYVAEDRQLTVKVKQVKEYFSTAVILMALGNYASSFTAVMDMLFGRAQQGLFTFYPEPVYPPDTDTNSLVFSILLAHDYPVETQAHHLLDMIKKYSVNGVAGVWLSASRKQQTDPIVSINAQVLALMLGREHEFQKNQQYVVNHLVSRDYRRGTRYYHSPDTFLYFLARLAEVDEDFKRQITRDLAIALNSRIGTTCHPLDLAQRVIVGKWLGMDIAREMEKLVSLQQPDGSLPADALFRLGSGKGYFGSKWLSTAFFIQALITNTKNK